tara:strand:+ start:1604 stop:1990 length:387 start_codon:yes stop_codon:yes gene_type:complete
MDDDWKYVNKKPIESEDNEKYWIMLYDEYLERFGLGEKFEKYLKLLQKKAVLQCKFITTNERFVINEIEIQNAKIESMQIHFGDGQSIEKTLIYLGKWLGYPLRIKETTVVEYYEILNEYGKWSNKEK